MSFFRATWNVLHKDLLIEIRTGEIVLSTGLFAAVVAVVASMAFGVNAARPENALAGTLWISIFFSGILALGRTFSREREFGAWISLMTTPVPRSAVFLGKALGVLIFLTAVELALVPMVAIFFRAPVLSNIGATALVLFLGTLGFAAVGTLFAAMTVRTRLRDLLLGAILYPLLAPLLISATKATSAIASGQGLSGAAGYIELIAVMDILYIAGGLWLFGPVMEE